MVRNVYLRNRPNRSRYGREKGGKFKFWPFCPLKRQLFWLVFWHCMACRWCPMQFGGARWSLGGPRVLPGGCLVVIGHKLKVLESLVKGVVCPLAPRGGVWGDPPPHSRAYLAPRHQQRGPREGGKQWGRAGQGISRGVVVVVCSLSVCCDAN